MGRLHFCLFAAVACLASPSILSGQTMRMVYARPSYTNDTSWMRAARKTPVQLKATTIDGQAVDLAAWRGKVVAIELWSLVDCDECTEQAEALKAVYTKYHAKGFEILRVVVGDSTIDKAMLTEEIARNDIKWPVSFTPSWDRDSTLKRYHIDFLPGLILYDQRGHFVSNTMKGDDLDAFLMMAFKTADKPKK